MVSHLKTTAIIRMLNCGRIPEGWVPEVKNYDLVRYEHFG